VGAVQIEVASWVHQVVFQVASPVAGLAPIATVCRPELVALLEPRRSRGSDVPRRGSAVGDQLGEALPDGRRKLERVAASA
jgi:hypothetical protein